MHITITTSRSPSPYACTCLRNYTLVDHAVCPRRTVVTIAGCFSCPSGHVEGKQSHRSTPCAYVVYIGWPERTYPATPAHNETAVRRPCDRGTATSERDPHIARGGGATVRSAFFERSRGEWSFRLETRALVRWRRDLKCFRLAGWRVRVCPLDSDGLVLDAAYLGCCTPYEVEETALTNVLGLRGVHVHEGRPGLCNVWGHTTRH